MLFCFAILLNSVQAQELATRLTATDSTEQFVHEYRVGPGDRLSLHVFDLPEFEQTLRVSNSGRIHVANLGTITVSERTLEEIEDEVAAKLRENQLIKDPWVRITILEYNSQPVYVVGAVQQPGQFMISGETRLLDVVTKAGGFAGHAGKEGFLIRRPIRPWIEVRMQFPEGENSDSRYQLNDNDSVRVPAENESVKINIKDLKEGTRPDLNVQLQGGDVFYVPVRTPQSIYVIGEVLYPGSYGLPAEYYHLTAARVVAFAGGPLRTAKSGSAFIVRYGKDGSFQALPFDFTAIRKGEQPDIPIQPEDFIYVPRSVAKTIGYTMINFAVQMTQQFIFF